MSFANVNKEARKGLRKGIVAIVDQELWFDILLNDGIVKMLEHGTVVSIKMDAMRKNKIVCERIELLVGKREYQSSR